jgi:hypothetical protein
MNVFDYIFYRIAKFYYKKDGLDAHGAIVILSVIQGILVIDILNILLRSFFSLNEIANYKLPIPISRIGIGLGIILMVLNYFRYKRQYWRLSERWRDKETTMQRKMRGWLVLLAAVSPLIIMVLLGTVFGRHSR